MKSPLFIIALLFVVGFMLVNKLSTNLLSDEPITLTKADPPKITMFGTSYCKYCELARAFFNKHNLPYVEHDIDASDKHRETFLLLGGKGTPLMIVNGEIIHGFDEGFVRDAL